jgi:hypothetical protein
MTEVKWGHYPIVAADQGARAWVQIQGNLGRAPNTVDAYGRDLEDYFRFSHGVGVHPESAARGHVAAYVRELAERPNARSSNIRAAGGQIVTLHSNLAQADRHNTILGGHIPVPGIVPELMDAFPTLTVSARVPFSTLINSMLAAWIA